MEGEDEASLHSGLTQPKIASKENRGAFANSLFFSHALEHALFQLSIEDNPGCDVNQEHRL